MIIVTYSGFGCWRQQPIKNKYGSGDMSPYVFQQSKKAT